MVFPWATESEKEKAPAGADFEGLVTERSSIPVMPAQEFAGKAVPTGGREKPDGPRGPFHLPGEGTAAWRGAEAKARRARRARVLQIEVMV